MTHYVTRAQYPQGSLTNHGLIKLIILIELEQRHQSWDQLVTRINPMVVKYVRSEEEEEQILSDMENDREYERVETDQGQPSQV